MPRDSFNSSNLCEVQKQRMTATSLFASLLDLASMVEWSAALDVGGVGPGNPRENCHDWTGRCPSENASPSERLDLSRACFCLLANLADKCGRDCSSSPSEHDATARLLACFLKRSQRKRKKLRPCCSRDEPNRACGLTRACVS
jgi:hypothetical protein